jgi:hypothetical protein
MVGRLKLDKISMLLHILKHKTSMKTTFRHMTRKSSQNNIYEHGGRHTHAVESSAQKMELQYLTAFI